MKPRIASILMSLIIINTSALAADNTVRTVNNARWQIQEQVDPQLIIEQNTIPDMASLYFVRPLDDDDIQSSANLAVNDRYQVSLQPGHFTHVNSCAGISHISVVTTSQKTNDLSLNAQTFNLNANENYYFLVDVDAMSRTTVQQIDKAQAMNLMNNQTYQKHQISRVQPTCMPQSIELEVLFDNDKYYVQPQYYAEIAKVAEYMANSPNTMVTIEGHTDNNASSAYNQQLSENRANAIKEILVQEYDISANRINAIGYGQSRPIASNSTAEGRQQNRRVVAVFSGL